MPTYINFIFLHTHSHTRAHIVYLFNLILLKFELILYATKFINYLFTYLELTL